MKKGMVAVAGKFGKVCNPPNAHLHKIGKSPFSGAKPHKLVDPVSGKHKHRIHSPVGNLKPHKIHNPV